MNDARRDVDVFARTVEALGPYLADLVFIGGWPFPVHSETRSDATPVHSAHHP